MNDQPMSFIDAVREVKRLRASEQQQSEMQDEFVNELLVNTPDEWDCDAAAEAIATHYVRHLESEVARLGGQLYPHWSDDTTRTEEV